MTDLEFFKSMLDKTKTEYDEDVLGWNEDNDVKRITVCGDYAMAYFFFSFDGNAIKIEVLH